jgi:uncharacterized protein
LLFADAPEVLLQKIEQIVRLIRSKGIGVYFVTQNPLDVPDVVLGQLGNRVQHALRAFTPRDLKAVRAAATTLRANPKVDVEKAIGELAVGEALVSFLDEKGQPGIVERAFVLPPKSQIGPIAPDVRAQIISRSVLYGHYEKAIDRESAHEILKQRGERFTQQPQPAPRPGAEQPSYPGNFPQPPPGRIPLPREPSAPRPTGRPRDTMLESMAKSAAHAIGSSVGRQIIRGIMGSILGGGRR